MNVRRFALVAVFAVGSLLSVPTGPAVAATTVFTSATEFDAKFPTLVKENFNDSLAPSANFLACTAPLTSQDGDLCFGAGDLPKGVSFRDEPAGGLSLVVGGPNWDGNTTDQLMTDAFADTFVMEFSKPVTVVGFNLVSHFNDVSCDVTVEFVSGSAPLDSSGSCTRAGTNFIGFRSDRPIASVTIDSAGNTDTSGIDNLRFGQPPANVTIKRVTNNLQNGTATMRIRVNGPGKVTVTGAKIKPQSKTVGAPKTVNLKVVRKQAVQGSSRVSVRVTFKPVTGPRDVKTRNVLLINN